MWDAVRHTLTQPRHTCVAHLRRTPAQTDSLGKKRSRAAVAQIILETF